MVRISREQFRQRLADRPLDLARVAADSQLSVEIKQAAQRADLDASGQVDGTAETNALFSELDRFDRDGSPNSLRQTPEIGRLFDLSGSGSRPNGVLNLLSGEPGTSTADPPAGHVVGQARGTGYYPARSRMEGGFKDTQEKPLHTLQDFLAGDADHVSIALDKKLYRSGEIAYGDRFRIPELEAKYGRPIEFRAVDTGNAFTGRGFSRVDICTDSRADSLEPTVNGPLTLIKLD